VSVRQKEHRLELIIPRESVLTENRWRGARAFRYGSMPQDLYYGTRRTVGNSRGRRRINAKRAGLKASRSGS
jgi:hypothetical protein